MFICFLFYHLHNFIDELQKDALERFIGSDALTWIDKEGTSLLSRILTNQSQVEVVVESAKELTQLGISYLSDTMTSKKSESSNVLELRRKRDERWKLIVGNVSNIFIDNLLNLCLNFSFAVFLERLLQH